MDHWSTIQNVSSTLNNCKHKPIIIGDGKRLLDIVSMSTQHKEYHSAFCQLVLLVESRLLAEEVHESVMRYNFSPIPYLIAR